MKLSEQLEVQEKKVGFQLHSGVVIYTISLLTGQRETKAMIVKHFLLLISKKHLYLRKSGFLNNQAEG